MPAIPRTGDGPGSEGAAAGTIANAAPTRGRDSFRIETARCRAFLLSGLMTAGLLASTPAGAIVGGQPTDPDEYRWQVLVFAETGNRETDRIGFCGGTLIARDWVMTAAHCLYHSDESRYVGPSEVTVRVGSWRWESGGRVVSVSELHPHPDYDPDLDVNDIALLKLAESAPVDLGAVVFPDEDTYQRIAVIGTEATALGWGVAGAVHERCRDDDDDNDAGCPDYSPVLREVGLTLRSRSWSSCSAILDPDTEICAGGTPGRSTCFSDSGGPLLLEERGTYYQIGITSSGSPRCDGSRAGTYARVARFHDWIRRTTRIGESFVVSMETPDPQPVVAAEGSDAVFTVSLAPAAGTEIRVPWRVVAPADDTAAESEDYRPANGIVTFAAGETEATIRVRAVSDSLSEGTETFSVELGDPVAPTASFPGAPDTQLPVELGATTTATAAISASDLLTVTLRSDSDTVLEGEEASYTVTLNHVPTADVTIHYATAAGAVNPAQPADFGTVRPAGVFPGGSITIAANSTEGTFRIPVLRDNVDDDEETFQVAVNVTGGGHPENPVVEGNPRTTTIVQGDDPHRNTVVVTHAVASMVGRGAARAAVDAISGRYRARASAPASSLKLAGRDIRALRETAGADFNSSDPGQAARALATAALLLDPDVAPGASAALSAAGTSFEEDGSDDVYAGTRRWLDWHGVTSRDLLAGSGFNLDFSGGDPDPGTGGWSVWGEGAFNGFESENTGISLDGDVASFHVGTDYQFGEWLLGLAVGRNRGKADFRDSAVEDPARSKGTVEMELINVLPYLQWSPDGEGESLVWGTVGAGGGEAGLKREGYETGKGDLDTLMIAGGARMPLAWQVGGWDVAAKVDAFRATSKTEALRTPDGTVQTMAEDDAHSSRVRGGAEFAKTRELASGAVDLKLEFNGRLDGGHLAGDTGLGGSDTFGKSALGAEVGGSVEFTGENGLTAALRGRYLVARGTGVKKEWGASAGVAYAPGGTGRGLGFSVAPVWGEMKSDAGAMWSEGWWLESAGRSGSEHSESDGWMPTGTRMRVDYGLNVRGTRVFMKPYAEAYLTSGNVERMHIGVRMDMARRAGKRMVLETFIEGDGDAGPDRLMLRGKLGF